MNYTENDPPSRLSTQIGLHWDRFLALESDHYSRGGHFLQAGFDIADAEMRSIKALFLDSPSFDLEELESLRTPRNLVGGQIFA